MAEEKNTEGWSARQLIKNLKGSSGSRQSATYAKATVAGSSRQFETPTQEEAQSRTRSVVISGNRQEAVGNSQPEATYSVGSRQFETPNSVGSPQSSVGSPHSVDGKAATKQAMTDERKSQAGGQKNSAKKAKGGVFKGLISGTIISESLILKDIRYTALIASLAIIFIANKFNAEKVERQIIVLEQEARDMRAESLSVSAELGSVSRQSEITELVKERGLGLEELREPPYRIVVNE